MTTMDVNKPPSKAELQQYIHKYKLDAQREANEDMDRLFERSNMLQQKLNADLIVFASVVLTIMGGIIAAREVTLSQHVKLVLAAGMFALLVSILAGLASYKTMSNFWLKWARTKHERGGIIENDTSKTYDDLVALRRKMMEHEKKLPETSSKLFEQIQLACFIVGLLLVVASIAGEMFDFSLFR